MGAVGGKAAGRVSIRVIPDATKFRADLKLLLKRVEQSMSANLMVTADTRAATLSVRQFVNEWNGKKVGISATMSTLGAAAQLRLFTRARFLDIIVRIRKDSLAKAGAAIAALSGARLAGDLVKNLAERLSNLDRSLPSIAMVATSISALVSVLLAGVGGIFTFGSGLAQVLGLAAAAPAILGGVATGATILVIALTDAKQRLAELGPTFTGLKSIISDNFWGPATQPIVNFVNGILPSLQSGLASSSQAIGTWAASVANGFGAALGGGAIDTLFANLVRSIEIATGGTGAFAQTLVTLGTVGSAYLPRLAQWVTDLSLRFDAFISAAAADGRLTAVIDAGIVAAQQLGSVLSSLVTIWAGISNAAERAGGGGLADAAATLARISEIISSPQFQNTLAELLVGASAGAAGLASALGPIGNMLTALAPTLAQILATSGQVVGQVLGEIAAALSSPAFSAGLGLFFSGLITGLQAVAPVLPQVAAALGSFLAFAGLLASNLGPVLGVLIGALAPALMAVFDALSPLLPILGQGLAQAVQLIAPVLTQLITTLLPPLVDLVSSIIPLLMPIISAILPVIAALLPPIVAIITALMPILKPILSALTPIVELLSAVLLPLLDVLTPVITILAEAFAYVANIISGVLQTAILLLVGLLTGDLSGAFDKIGALWVDLWAGMQESLDNAWVAIQDLVRNIANNIIGQLEGFVNTAFELLNGLASGAADIANGIASALGIKASVSFAPLGSVSLPRLAVGADILPSRGGTAVLLGEGGRRETVTDWGRTNRLINAATMLAERSLSGSGNSGPLVAQTIIAAPGMNEETVGRIAGESVNFELRRKR